MAAVSAFDEMYGLADDYGSADSNVVSAAYRSIQAWLAQSPPEVMAARRRF